MDAPDPEKEKVPSGRIRGFLRRLIFWNKTNTPLAGQGIKIDVYPGKGTMISLKESNGIVGDGTMDIIVCIDGTPTTVRFVTKTIPS